MQRLVQKMKHTDVLGMPLPFFVCVVLAVHFGVFSSIMFSG